MTVIDGIHSLLRQPGGCGEQNMIRFGPNVAIAKYLRASGHLVGDKKAEMTELLKRGAHGIVYVSVRTVKLCF